MQSCVRSSPPQYRVETIPVDTSRGNAWFVDAAERTRGNVNTDDSTYHLRIIGEARAAGHYVRLRSAPPAYDSMYIQDHLVRGDNTLAVVRERRSVWR